MELKEVRRRDGSIVVFCDFEELLMDFYGVSTIEQVESNLGSNGEYIIHCPFCRDEGHTKHKLYIKGDLTVGHCFVCTRSFVNVTDKIDTSFSIPSSLTSFGFGIRPLEVVPLTDPTWTLDKYNNEFDSYDQRGVEYLIGRHKYLADLWQPLGFKFWDSNIVMPFKYHGEVFYYQIRFTGSTGSIRYFFPPISAKPPYIIEHGERPGKKIIICEGVYDAVSLLIQAPSYTPCAVLGSSISDYQISFLREYVPEKILIYMDETKISRRIADKIKSEIGYCDIRIIPSDGEDPEECMKRKMLTNSEIGWIDERF